MKNDILNRFQHIDTLIQEQRTGTPAELAQTKGVSERTIHRTIKHMKKLGAPIAFNLLTKSYYYKEEGSFVCAFSLSEKAIPEKFKLSITSTGEFIQQMDKIITLNNN